MKGRLLVFLILINIYSNVSACIYSGLNIWPPTTHSLPTNPVFVLTHYGGISDFLTKIKEGNFMYLVNKSDTVRLLLLDTFISEGYRFEQAHLKPDRILNPLTHYKAVFSYENGSYNYYDCYNSLVDKRTGYIIDYWKTQADIDTVIPDFLNSSKFRKNKFVSMGTSCAAMYSLFNVKTYDTTPTIYKVLLRYKKDSFTQQFFISPHKRDSLLYIGGEEFDTSPYRWYTITIEAMDNAGNYSDPKTIRFHTPYFKAFLLIPGYLLSLI